MSKGRSLIGDLNAGIFTVVNLSPIDVGYGLILASAVGLAYSGLGLAAAFLSVLVGNLVMATVGQSGLIFSGARPAQTLLVAELLVSLTAPQGGSPSFITLWLYTAICVFTAGSLELGLGLLRAGRLIKHLPIPVLTGYINAVALLIVGPATLMMLGFPRGTHWADLLSRTTAATVESALFSLVLLGLMVIAHNRFKRLHWSVVGLFGGVAIYTVLYSVTGAQAGVRLPDTGDFLPSGEGIQALFGFSLPASLTQMVSTVLPYALAIAVLNAIESLLAAAKYEELSELRFDANRVLIDQGLANMLGGLVGALPIAPSISRVLIAHELGGRQARSLVVAALASAVIMLLGGAALAWVPLSVVGALMGYLAWTMLDQWTHGQFRKVFILRHLEPTLRRQVETNLMIMMLVVSVALSGHLIAAMFAGAMLAMFIFVRDYSRSVIGRTFSGEHRHSLVMRSERATDFLSAHGKAILVQELCAPIVFGTADRLFDHLSKTNPSVRFLVLDFQIVREVDDKGARILVRLAKSLSRRGVALHLACMHPAGPRGSVLKDAGMLSVVPLVQWHADVDCALESIENALLAAAQFAERERMDLHDLDVLAGLTESELTTAYAYLGKECFASGATIFSAGDEGDHLYIVAMGRVEIRIPLDATGKATRRIAGFAPGAVFGEMAMFRGGTRSANAIAAGDTAVWSLSARDFARLQLEAPVVANKLMINIVRQLSSRLAVTNNELVYATRGIGGGDARE